MAGGEFEDLVERAMAEPIEGWPFPFLEARIVRDEPSWDWDGSAREPLGGRPLDGRWRPLYNPTMTP